MQTSGSRANHASQETPIGGNENHNKAIEPAASQNTLVTVDESGDWLVVDSLFT